MGGKNDIVLPTLPRKWQNLVVAHMETVVIDHEIDWGPGGMFQQAHFSMGIPGS
jgi:hypothetical protein